jgi:ribosomal protein S18 acetylase RimI-like enzyme
VITLSAAPTGARFEGLSLGHVWEGHGLWDNSAPIVSQVPEHDRPQGCVIRAATRADLSFLRLMLYEAGHWRAAVPRPSVDDALAERSLARYVAGWGRSGDRGLVADDGSVSIGAAWYRLFPDDDPGYGFVSPTIPELTIAVAGSHRLRGTGTKLLEALVVAARDDGFSALSLSVEPDNHALSLYRRAGFERVGLDEGAWTMLLTLADRRA